MCAREAHTVEADAAVRLQPHAASNVELSADETIHSGDPGRKLGGMAVNLGREAVGARGALNLGPERSAPAKSKACNLAELGQIGNINPEATLDLARSCAARELAGDGRRLQFERFEIEQTVQRASATQAQACLRSHSLRQSLIGQGETGRTGIRRKLDECTFAGSAAGRGRLEGRVEFAQTSGRQSRSLGGESRVYSRSCEGTGNSPVEGEVTNVGARNRGPAFARWHVSCRDFKIGQLARVNRPRNVELGCGGRKCDAGYRH